MEEFVPAGTLQEVDPFVDEIIRYESERQQRKLIMIASESICPPAVRKAMASRLSHIYAEGYPSPRTLLDHPTRLGSFQAQLAAYRRLSNRRYYKGCEYVDILEQTLRRRTAEVFANERESADTIFVNTQPLSGAAANNAVYNAFVKPGEVVMGPSLTHGGHLTHGSEVNRSGMNFRIVPYEISRSGQLDYEAIGKLAALHKPKLIIGGFSAYPWDIDWEKMRHIADSVQATLLADIAHLAGMVAASVLNSPVGHAHVTSFTTHKTLCGPRGAMLLSTDPEIAARVDMGVFPGEQGGPHIHVLAAKAVAMRIAASNGFRALQKGVLENAQALANGFRDQGLRLAYGGTNTHLVLLDLRHVKTPSKLPLTGEIASRVLDLCGIVCNKNTIFGDTNATHPSGIRFGTTWVTQRGLGPSHMRRIAELVTEVLTNIHAFGYIGGSIIQGRGKQNQPVLLQVADKVDQLVQEANCEPTFDQDQTPTGYPHFPTKATGDVQKSPLYTLHKSQAVKMVEKDGWLVPDSYGDVDREKKALTEGSALVDSGGELLVEVSQGKAGQLLEGACSTEILSLPYQHCAASLILDPAGAIMARALVVRLPPDEVGDDRFWLKIRTDQSHQVLRWLRGLSDGYLLHDEDLWLKCEGPAVIEDLAAPSDQRSPMTCLGLRGPKATDVVQTVFGVDSLPEGGVRQLEEVTILNRPENTLAGFELFVPVQKTPAIWSRLVEAGAQPAGLLALSQVLSDSQQEEAFDNRIHLHKPFFIGQKAQLSKAAPVEALREFSFEPKAEQALKETCLIQEHERLCKKKNLVPFAGWRMPVMYSGILQEHQAVRNNAGIFDVSHMGVFEFSGAYAERFLDLVSTNYVPLLQPGQAHYSYLLDHKGRCIDDVIIYRLDRQRFIMVVNAANADEDQAWLEALLRGEVQVDPHNPRAQVKGSDVRLRNLKDPQWEQDRLVDIALQGPKAYHLLRQMTQSRSFQLDIQRLNKFEMAQGELVGIPSIIARTGYTGEEIGYEIFVHPQQASRLFTSCLEIGKPLGVEPCGLGARDSLRTEAGFPLHGHELASVHQISPIESGYGSYVRLHKPFFIGRAAMLEGHKNQNRSVVRFALEDKGGRVLRPNNPVLAGRKAQYAGVVTSAVATGSRQVGQALIDSKFAKVGTDLHILPIVPGDREPPARTPFNLTSGDWMCIPRKATVLSRFMSGQRDPTDRMISIGRCTKASSSVVSRLSFSSFWV